MTDALFWHRLQFAFTAVYHYLFPQLTMGLALFIVLLKSRPRDEAWTAASRFWVRIFGLNFAVGVVTGIPMEFQFGTNWAGFSAFAGQVVGHTLAMEGLFAFFLESTFIGILVYGEGRVSERAHRAAAVALFVGSWLSGYFIVATNAFLQHPVGYIRAPDGRLLLANFGEFVLNPWALAEYAHTIVASVVTASFVVCAAGAYYLLRRVHMEPARVFLRLGVPIGFASCVLVAFPTGDRQAKLVARHQPIALAAMEGRFESGGMAEINLIGQPNVRERKLDNKIAVPGILSFLAYGTFQGDVRGLSDFPEDLWPDNIELAYYAFHIMAGLGTLLGLVMAAALVASLTGRLESTPALLWTLMLAFPFPYIANTAGWLTTELGRQPWLVYGLLRTADGASPLVHSGTALFTLIGFCGLYLLLGVAFLAQIVRELEHGPLVGEAPGHHG
jgi:cytochrome d ubiquinol oxidase subunit I